MSKKDELLKNYIISVRHPTISGFEVLELLDVRSALAKLDAELEEEERLKLEEADDCFLSNANIFYESLLKVTDLAEMRKRVKVSPSHWWWYIDRLVRTEKTIVK